MLFGKKDTRPTAEDVAHRLTVLMRLVGYSITTPPQAVLQKMMAQWSPRERGEFEHSVDLRRIEYWRPVHEYDLWKYLTPKERIFANTSAITMTEQQRMDFSWRVVGVEVLLWALDLLPAIPPYDQEPNPDLLKTFSLENYQCLATQGRFRSQTEVDRARGTAELWHWRSRTRDLIEDGEEFQPDEKLKSLGLNSLDDIVRRSAQMAAANGDIPSCIDQDFPVLGKAYRDLTADEWSLVRSITMERHFALNWLCGYAPGNRWDDTPTDT